MALMMFLLLLPLSRDELRKTLQGYHGKPIERSFKQRVLFTSFSLADFTPDNFISWDKQ